MFQPNGLCLWRKNLNISLHLYNMIHVLQKLIKGYLQYPNSQGYMTCNTSIGLKKFYFCYLKAVFYSQSHLKTCNISKIKIFLLLLMLFESNFLSSKSSKGRKKKKEQITRFLEFQCITFEKQVFQNTFLKIQFHNKINH